MMRFFPSRRIPVGLVLLGLMAPAIGCDSGPTAPENASPEAKAQVSDMTKAMQNQNLDAVKQQKKK